MYVYFALFIVYDVRLMPVESAWKELQDLFDQGLRCYLKGQDFDDLREALVRARRDSPWTFLSDSECSRTWRFRGRLKLRAAYMRTMTSASLPNLTVREVVVSLECLLVKTEIAYSPATAQAIIEGLEHVRSYAAFASAICLPTHRLNPEPLIGWSVPAAAGMLSAVVGSIDGDSEGIVGAGLIAKILFTPVVSLFRRITNMYDE